MGKKYEGKEELGNTKSGDGYRYKGRGLIPIVGRQRYKLMGDRLGIDLETRPEELLRPELALRAACLDWVALGLNAIADLDDFALITMCVATGLGDNEHRWDYRGRARRALKPRVRTAPKETRLETGEILRDFGTPSYDGRLLGFGLKNWAHPAPKKWYRRRPPVTSIVFGLALIAHQEIHMTSRADFRRLGRISSPMAHAMSLSRGRTRSVRSVRLGGSACFHSPMID